MRRPEDIGPSVRRWRRWAGSGRRPRLPALPARWWTH